jgi:hypothetical protein
LPLLPMVEEAISSLGYFIPDAAPALASMIERKWGWGAKMLFGIREEWLPLLTDKGRADPYHAAKATCLRVTCNHRRDHFLTNPAGCDKAEWEVSISAIPEFVCSIMKGHHCSTFPWDGLPLLPQPGCDKEWCICTYTLSFPDD